MPKMIDLGLLRATLSTDDPGIFRSNLGKEYIVAVLECRLTLEEMWACQEQGYQSTFIPKSRTEEKWQAARDAWRNMELLNIFRSK